MPNPGPFLFVSHISEDRDAAMAIVDELERRGQRCWIAPRDVRPGKPFDDEISDALDASLAMVLIFSEGCNDSEYIRREVTVAGESQKPVIPFRIENTQPRRGLRVRLSDLHWIDAFVSRERGIDDLLKTLHTAGPDPDPVAAASAMQGEKAPAAAPRNQAPASAQLSVGDGLEADQGKQGAGGRIGFDKPSGAAVADFAGVSAEQAQAKPRARRSLLLVIAIVAPVAFLAIALAVVKGGGAPQPALEAAPLVEQGDRAAAEKDYDLAIADYSAAIRLDPQNSHAYLRRGTAYYEGKKSADHALEDLNEAVRLDPRSAPAFLERGIVYAYGKESEGKADYPRAIADYSEAIRLDPNFAPPRLKRGIAYIYGVKSPRKDDYDRAIVDYTEAIRLRPDYSEAYFFRGVAYQNGVADADRAIADYTEAIRLKPDYGIAFSNRGIIYQNLKKDLPRAIADYTEAIRLLPNFAVPYYHRGLALKQSGGNGDLDIAKAKQLDPSVGD